MKKILYIEPKHHEKRYLYYTYLGKELLKKENIDLTIKPSLNGCELQTYNLVILGYGACSNKLSIKKQLNVPIIAFLFKLSVEKDEKMIFFKENDIIVFGQQYRIPEFSKTYNININKALYPMDYNLFCPKKIEKIYDICMTGAIHDSKHYNTESFANNEKQLRKRIVNKLNEMNIRKFINCSDINKKAYIENINEYITLINQSKFWVCVSADYGDLTPRFCEVICCKTLIFCNEQNYDTFNDIFIDGETCVIFKNDLSDMESKIHFYLNNPEKCNTMVEQMYQTYMNTYSSAKLVDRLLNYAND